MPKERGPPPNKRVKLQKEEASDEEETTQVTST